MLLTCSIYIAKADNQVKVVDLNLTLFCSVLEDKMQEPMVRHEVKLELKFNGFRPR